MAEWALRGMRANTELTTVYRAHGRAGQVVFSTSVLEHLFQHRQTRLWQKEAGGQLFARIRGDTKLIERATGPRPTDRRSRRSYRPDTKAEQSEIYQMHAVGLDYVGDWHTHPERIPHPSGVDQFSMSDCVAKSRHMLDGFLMVIVGTEDPPDGLHVSLVGAAHSIVLTCDVFLLAPSPRTNLDVNPGPE